MISPLRWRHNGRDSVSNHQPHHCLLKRLFRRRSKNISKLRVTGLCVGNSPGTGEFPAQMASNAENVSIWWRYHLLRGLQSVWLDFFSHHSDYTVYIVWKLTRRLWLMMLHENRSIEVANYGSRAINWGQFSRHTHLLNIHAIHAGRLEAAPLISVAALHVATRTVVNVSEIMMTSWHGSIFHITGPLGPAVTKVSYAEPLVFWLLSTWYATICDVTII